MRTSTASAIRWAVALLALLISAVSVGLAVPAAAKEIDLIGNVECGQREGHRCSVEDQLVVWTDALSGRRERFVVDVSWVKKNLPALDQGDAVCLTVETRPGGALQAIGVIEPCEVEGTVNRGLSTGSRDVAERGRRPLEDDDDDDKAQQTLVTLPPSPPGGSVTLEGVVRDAITGTPIPGATVRGPGGTTATTDQNGRFSLTGAPTGRQPIEVSRSGFITNARTVVVAASQNRELSIALVPVAFTPDITITLTWGTEPPDLDAHLSGPAQGGGRFHVFFGQPRPVAYAELTRDDEDRFGPETIVIRRDPASGQFVPGEYRFWVHNFSRSPEFDASAAHVDVTQGGRDIADFDVEEATGDPRLDIWHVVNLQVDAAGNVTLSPIQRFTPGDEATILHLPDPDAKRAPKQP